LEEIRRVIFSSKYRIDSRQTQQISTATTLRLASELNLFGPRSNNQLMANNGVVIMELFRNLDHNLSRTLYRHRIGVNRERIGLYDTRRGEYCVVGAFGGRGQE